VHETVARARFHIKTVKNLSGSEHFWKMISAKGAGDCRELDFICQPHHHQVVDHIKLFTKTEGRGALLEDEVGKMCTRL